MLGAPDPAAAALADLDLARVRAQVIKASLGPLPFVHEDADGEEAGANGAEPAAAPRPPPAVRSSFAASVSEQWATSVACVCCVSRARLPSHAIICMCWQDYCALLPLQLPQQLACAALSHQIHLMSSTVE